MTPSPGASEAALVTYRALSLKQPWAALLVTGRKTIEVRRWPTAYRGPLLIHAARVADPREEAWARVPPDLAEAARLERGVVGAGVLVDCKRYGDAEAFAADRERHLNDPAWFEPAGLYGLCFAELRVLPFRPAPGWVRIFKIEVDGIDALTATTPPPPPPPPRGEGEPERVMAGGRMQRLIQSLGGKAPGARGS